VNARATHGSGLRRSPPGKHGDSGRDCGVRAIGTPDASSPHEPERARRNVALVTDAPAARAELGTSPGFGTFRAAEVKGPWLKI